MRRSKSVIAVKNLVKAGTINLFKDIFQHITFREAAKELNITARRLQRISESPNLMTLRETIIIADQFGTSQTKMFHLILRQVDQA